MKVAAAQWKCGRPDAAQWRPAVDDIGPIDAAAGSTVDPFPPRFMAMAFALGIRLQADVERRRRCSAIGRVSVYGSCCSTSFSNDVQTDASVATRVAHFLIVTLRRSRFLSQLEGVRELLRWRSLPIAELGDVCASANAVLIVSELTHVLFFRCECEYIGEISRTCMKLHRNLARWAEAGHL